MCLVKRLSIASESVHVWRGAWDRMLCLQRWPELAVDVVLYTGAATAQRVCSSDVKVLRVDLKKKYGETHFSGALNKCLVPQIESA